MVDSDDERDAGDDSTAPLGTPGFNQGSPQNPSRMMPNISPQRNTSDFLGTSGIPGMGEGFSPFGQDKDSIQQPDMFGITDSTRRILTAKGLVDLLAESISKDDMRQVVIDRLNKSGGLVEAIRVAGFESLEASPAITDKAKIIFENIMVNIQVKCADIFQEVLAEIFDMMAPKICSHFSLVQQTADEAHRRIQQLEAQLIAATTVTTTPRTTAVPTVEMTTGTEHRENRPDLSGALPQGGASVRNNFKCLLSGHMAAFERTSGHLQVALSSQQRASSQLASR